MPGDSAAALDHAPDSPSFLRERIRSEVSSASSATYAERQHIFRNDPDARVSFDRYKEDLEHAANAAAPTLEMLSVPEPTTVGEIVARLRRWGVVAVPGLVPEATLAQWGREFDQLLAGEAGPQSKLLRMAAATQLQIAPQLLDARFPITRSFFLAPLLREIAEAYLASDRIAFNRALFVQQTSETREPPSGALHFDVTRMLKFWVYLNPATVANGAMRAVPASHLWIRNLREEFSERVVAKHRIQNEVDESSHRAIPICGPAGTLFIFDTDMAHGAGTVAPGGIRRIMRAHTVQDYLAARARLRPK